MIFQLLLDENGYITFAENEVEAWYGGEEHSLAGKSIVDLLPEPDAQLLISFLSSSTPTIHLATTSISNKVGLVSAANAVFSKTPAAHGVHSIIASFSLAPVSTALANPNLTIEAHASFFERHPFGVVHLDRGGRVINVNKQLTADIGHTLASIQQYNLLPYITPVNRLKVLQRYKHALANAEAASFDVEVLTAQGTPLPVNLTFIPVLYQGKTVELYVVVKNIAHVMALQKNLKKLSLVADKITDGVMVLNHNFEIDFINEGFTQISGFSYQEAIGKRLRDVTKTGDNAPDCSADVRERLGRGEAVELELQCEKKDGAGYWNLLRLTPIKEDNGLEMCIVIHTDITEKKMAEMELRLLADDLYRQNKELHQFAYIVSHNMRSPVANIVGLANLLEIFKDDPETQSQTLKELSKSVNNLDTVIKDLSYILTINNATKELLKEPVNFQDLLQQVLIDLQPQIILFAAELSIASKPLIIRTNRAYLYSIFFNLISNALKYKSHQTPYIKIDYYQTTEHTVIYVADNGKGIDLNKHGHELFKPYKRFDFKVEGKGLGLFLVKSHIEALGGHLTVKSELNKGSTFYIKIPLL